MEDDFGWEAKSPISKEDEMLKYAHNRTNAGDPSANKPNPERSKGRPPENVNGDDFPLPQRFVVKYLGVRETTNLWGIKHTRGPVDEMVSEAKRKLTTSSGTLPLLNLEVSSEGVTVGPMPQNVNPNFPQGRFPIESISYGVQDLVYTRVFAMIVVKPKSEVNGTQSEGVSVTAPKLSQLERDSSGALPFRCHAFVTDRRETAKNLTYTLAAAFQKFSQKVSVTEKVKSRSKQIAIDLRSGQEGKVDDLDSSEA